MKRYAASKSRSDQGASVSAADAVVAYLCTIVRSALREGFGAQPTSCTYAATAPWDATGGLNTTRIERLRKGFMSDPGKPQPTYPYGSPTSVFGPV